jgi:hypothetical protein
MQRFLAYVLAVLLSLILVPRGNAADGPALRRLQTPGGVEFGILGEKPPSPRPVLFLIALDLRRTLTDPDYNRIAALLEKEGFLCVALDVPCHGNDNPEQVADALAGWRQRIERGVDVPAR